MKIAGFVWLEEIVQKLVWKHSVETEEVREIFLNNPKFRFIEKGHRKDENVYAAFGQTDRGKIFVLLLRSQTRRSRSRFVSERYGRRGEKTLWQKIKARFQKRNRIGK